MTPVQVQEPIIPLNYFSSFTRLQRVTAWVMRFINHCRQNCVSSPILTVKELSAAEKYWIRIIQAHFTSDIAALKNKCGLSNDSSLLSLRPFIDSDGLLRVGGRESNSNLSYQRMHPLIIHGKHPHYQTHHSIRTPTYAACWTHTFVFCTIQPISHSLYEEDRTLHH